MATSTNFNSGCKMLKAELKVIVTKECYASSKEKFNLLKLSIFVNIDSIIAKCKSCYFLIRCTQTEIILFAFANDWVIKENESFLLVEPCSRV